MRNVNILFLEKILFGLKSHLSHPHISIKIIKILETLFLQKTKCIFKNLVLDSKLVF